jgi:hypothetical protein
LRAPQLGPLAILEVALTAFRAALLAEHPRARLLGTSSLAPQPPIVALAALVLERTAELRVLLARYRRRARHELRAEHHLPAHQTRQAELDF